ncbi:hypothetical protein HRbin30_02253 [bacterium HR30]|nr:hypothetical protein HRbin30_02253 [bacterium HR30]
MSSNFSCRAPRVRLLHFALVFPLALGASPRCYGEPPLVDASVVPLYVGQEVTVEARVRAARREGNTVRFQLEQAPHPVEVVLVEGLLSRFRQNPEGFVGKAIRASGSIREFRGQWEIVVRDPQNIGLAMAPDAGAVAPVPRSTVQASPGLPASPTDADRWQALEARLERLEASVHELRSGPDRLGPSPEGGSEENCNERLRKVELRLRQLERKLEQGR